jgi:glycerophosphoryl diester phosphodiesterase
VDYGSGAGPLAIAHRGGAALALENTLDAFGASRALGVRYFETDVRLTRDGVPVLFHDVDLRRVFARNESVGQLLYRDLPLEVTTLEAALQCFPDACFTVDVKESHSIPAVADVLRRTGAAHRVCVAGAWDGTLRELARSSGPELSVAMGWRDLCRLVTSSHSRLPLLRRGRPSFAHVPLHLGRVPVFAERLLHRAHHLDVRVVVWTVNDPAIMTRLLDAGADGIITDRPDLLRELLISRGNWTAPARGVHPLDPLTSAG